MRRCRLQLGALLLLLATATASRSLQQYDCEVAEEECKRVSCNGLLKAQCDSTTGRVQCTCESGGLVSCFPGAATVALAGGATKRIADVALGDSVLAVGPDGRLRFSPVALFSSRRPAQRAPFLRVHTDAGLNITATPGHYLFAWKAAQAAAAYAALPTPDAWPLVLPTELRVGDLVPVAAAVAAGAHAAGGSPALARVVGVERVSEEGVYMPHTLTGAIVVDGVVASELTSVVPPRFAGAATQRRLAAALRLAARLLPPRVLEGAVRAVSSWAHGTPDASLSHTLLRVAAAPAAA